MVCPVCPTVGVFGGYLGGYLGVNVPEETEHQLISAGITAVLLVASIVAMKYFFGISICDGNGDFSLRNIVQVGIIAIIVGIIYSIAVNYLIKRYLESSSQEVNPVLPPSPQNRAPQPCCCQYSLTN